MRIPGLPYSVADENFEASEALALALQEKVLLYSHSTFFVLYCVILQLPLLYSFRMYCPTLPIFLLILFLTMFLLLGFDSVTPFATGREAFAGERC